MSRAEPGAGSADVYRIEEEKAVTESADQTVTGSPETGSPETGSPETGSPETGSPETGSPESDADPTQGPEAVEPGDAEQGDAEPADSEAEESATSDRIEQLEAEGDIAADYLEELLDIADFDGDLDMDVEGDRAAVSISGGDLSALVGKDGQVLEALQELTRLAVYQVTGERTRLMLDIDGHRATRRAAVERVARTAVERVKESGEAQHLDVMNPFERKVAHDVVAAAGLTSESEGVEPRRHVVVLPHD